MRISTNKKYINVFKALASEVRLDIISLLAQQPMNIKDIAAAAGLSRDRKSTRLNSSH